MCGRCSSCRHVSIVFKKKWKPAEAGNTGRGEENSRSSQMNRIDACIRMYGNENRNKCENGNRKRKRCVCGSGDLPYKGRSGK